jgi:hypothetical protein
MERKSLPRKSQRVFPPGKSQHTDNIEIDAGDTLPGPIQLSILQYLPEILDNKKLFKHSIVKATNKPRKGVRYLKVNCKDLDLCVKCLVRCTTSGIQKVSKKIFRDYTMNGLTDGIKIKILQSH